MRIAMFSETYVPTKDGVAVYVGALKEALERMGHDVIVFTASRGDAEAGVHRHMSLTVPFYPQYKLAVFPYWNAYKILKKFKPDVVHLHTPFAVGSAGFLSARKLRIPIVGSFHTNIRDMSKSVHSILANRAFVAMGWRYSLGIYWRCNALTVPSAVVRDFIHQSAIKPFKTDIRVVWTLPDVSALRAKMNRYDMRKELGLQGKFVVTFLSRLVRDKGIYTFLDCACKNRDFSFVIGGTGPEENAVRKYIADRKLENVKFLGFVEEPKKPALLNASDVVVLPSFADTFGIILIEAMACGAVAVGSDAGGIVEFLKHGENGMLFRAGDAGALSNVLQVLAGDHALCAKLRANASEFIARHGSIENSAKAMVKIYEEVVNAGWKRFV